MPDEPHGSEDDRQDEDSFRSLQDAGPGPTVFIGDDPERGIDVHGGPSEFWTADGKHVYVHDMNFIGLDYREGPVPELRLTFDWWEEKVEETYAGPIVEFTFGDAEILQWNSRKNLIHRDVAGQVSWFDYRGDGVFWLSAWAVWIAFTARTCQVTTRERTSADVRAK